MATTPPDQCTLLVSELERGRIYRDALSGYLVLVREVEVAEYALDKDMNPTKNLVKRMTGWFWNPVFGVHQEMPLHDHQLIDAEHETGMKPDTRYDKGYHGL